MLAFHRAIAKEFSSRYYERVHDLVALRRGEQNAQTLLESMRVRGDAAPHPTYPSEATLERLLRGLPPDIELYELAAQFETEPYEGPPPQRLHEFWVRVDAVSGGVLFRHGYAPLVRSVSSAATAPSMPRGQRQDLAEVHEQGMRELVALTGVVERIGASPASTSVPNSKGTS